MGLDGFEWMRMRRRRYISGPGPAIITGLVQVIKPRVFGSGAHSTGIQTLNLHGFSATLRNGLV
jgi:hypothetical protein